MRQLVNVGGGVDEKYFFFQIQVTVIDDDHSGNATSKEQSWGIDKRLITKFEEGKFTFFAFSMRSVIDSL